MVRCSWGSASDEMDRCPMKVGTQSSDAVGARDGIIPDVSSTGRSVTCDGVTGYATIATPDLICPSFIVSRSTETLYTRPVSYSLSGASWPPECGVLPDFVTSVGRLPSKFNSEV